MLQRQIRHTPDTARRLRTFLRFLNNNDNLAGANTQGLEQFAYKVVAIFVGEDTHGKDGDPGNALALSMQPDEARGGCNQKMTTRVMKSAL